MHQFFFSHLFAKAGQGGQIRRIGLGQISYGSEVMLLQKIRYRAGVTPGNRGKVPGCLGLACSSG